MDILAWIVVGLTISFVFLPGFAAFLFGDDFISYKDAWLLGNGLTVIFTALVFGVSGIAWAFRTVLS